MVDLAAEARKHGLPICAELIAALPAMQRPEIDAALSSPPATKDPVAAIEDSRRRGLDPRLVRSLFDWFAGRPLELGLFSWDALCASLIEVTDTGLLATLRKNAAVVRDLLPAPGSTFANFSSLSSAKAVERWALPRYAGRRADQLGEAGSLRAIGALDQLRRLGGTDALAGLAESTRKFAWLLHLSHMSTLASFYLDYVVRVLGHRAAIVDLVEVLLDVGAADALPSADEIVADKSAASFELFGYVQARAGIIRNQSRQVIEELKQHVQLDYATVTLESAVAAPRIHLVVAEAQLRQKELTVPFEVIDSIATHHPQWRYAHRIRAACAAASATEGDLPLSFAEKFLEQFGNDFRLWYSMRRYAASTATWPARLLQRLAGEVAALPHDWMAWASLGSAIKSADRNGLDEVNARAEQQCALTTAN